MYVPLQGELSKGSCDPADVTMVPPERAMRLLWLLDTTPVLVIAVLAEVTKEDDSTGRFGGESQHDLVHAYNGVG